MLVDNPYDAAVWNSLLDFYTESMPWTRRLWRLSAPLEVEELLEAWKARQAGVLAESSVKYLAQGLINRVKRDPGFGGMKERGILVGHLNRDLPPRSHDAYALRLLLEEAHEKYLSRWAEEIRSSRPPAEIVSRAVGSYLLDIGYSQVYLHKWWTYHGKYGPLGEQLVDLVDRAADLARRPTIRYGIMVPLTAAPPLPPDDDHWYSASRTANWLARWFPDAPPARQDGGLLLQVDARDRYSAVAQVAAEAKRLESRFRVGTRQRLEFGKRLYLTGDEGGIPFAQPPRRVQVLSLQRYSAIFGLTLSHELGAVLELLEPLDAGTPAAAVTGSWAAIETLFVGPGDTANRVVAANRMARIVACSYAAVELASIANVHLAVADDRLAERLRALPDGVARAREFEEALRGGVEVAYERVRHDLALRRMAALVAQPEETMRRVVAQLEDAFRRLYRQRNLIVHAGDLTSVALAGTLRTLAPLVGAGVDRVVHASATTGASPIELAATAEVNLARVASRPIGLVDVLA
ncbi:hypothetical protein Val02_91150 [Virgisporangium aliadipatigenens]|uniref:Integrase n=1 Tax=Virgisporangium aliadipatigenens TaxID=741659 RepID=A0A8J3YV39_9ACTN|nr:hypothetical protein [Virgisporangium aliadipatigenens]GIJ52229.1 hypothetical protein Val02_91150 [Virgisporangium aliadipatigenens]